MNKHYTTNNNRTDYGNVGNTGMKIYAGYGQAIEVSDEWNEILLDSDRLEANNDKRESRRHCSLDAYNLDDALLP